MHQVKNLEIFFSNRLEILYQQLKHSLFKCETSPLQRRLLVVYGPAMKTWLMLRMAQDPELRIATGIECIYLNQAFETLLKLAGFENDLHYPTQLEIALAIETECVSLIHNFKTLSFDEQRDWEPLIKYLKLNLHDGGSHIILSRKMEKRLTSLSQHLARYFHDYGRYALQMVSKWEMPDFPGWQPRLWRKLFGKSMGWSYPARSMQQVGISPISSSLHFFSISFMTAKEFDFLNRLSEHTSIKYYLLSPCAVFWSDIRSDRENAFLDTYWQQKLGSFSSKMIQLEEFLRDRNPLLANFGRLGREMAHQIEESQAQTHAHYILPRHVQSLNEEISHHEDLDLSDSEDPLSLLHAVQADLLMMRNPQGYPPFNLEDEKGSLELHIAPNRRREIQILYHNLLRLINDTTISPGDMIVMAPQIGDYVPYIESIFGIKSSQLDYQILDLGMQTKSEIVQGFLLLIELSESRWDANNFLQLFENYSFQRCHQLSPSDYSSIKEWVEKSGIRWGDDTQHRNELLQRSHCQQGMVEETTIGTWDYGISRLLMGLITFEASPSSLLLEIPPCSIVDFSQGELLGKWLHLLYSLRDDLSPLQNRIKMTMDDWVDFLICLLESYFKPDFDHPQSLEEFDELKTQFEILRNSARLLKGVFFPFTTIKSHLLALLQSRGITYREDHLQSVRFCSLVPLRSIPAKVIAILGLQEGSFPRTDRHSSLNLMQGSEETDYCPTNTDYDRYLFLEALHSAQSHLILSYQGYENQDGKEIQPSLLLQELFSYCDKFYTINGKKVSQVCIFKHPFDSFDERYFSNENGLYNFSQHDYRAALTLQMEKKFSPHSFLSNFNCIQHPQPMVIENDCQINLKHLISVARNPIKFYLNKVLEIYLQTETDRKLKIEEEFKISSLDKNQLIQSALKTPIEAILNFAEKEGKLPFGLFKEVAVNRLNEEVEEIHENLKKHSVNCENIFQIEFSAGCLSPTQLDEDRWLFPSIKLNYEDGYKISIIGKLSHVSSNGLLTLGKMSLPNVWKAWPQFLLYCSAAKVSPQKFEPQLIFAYSGKSKKAFFDNPELYLKQFVNYYSLCLRNFSPLLPDWISFILENDKKGLQDKMKQLFSESFGGYQNHDLRWILNPNLLPSSQILIDHWKKQTELLLGDLIHHWFSSKKGNSEEI